MNTLPSDLLASLASYLIEYESLQKLIELLPEKVDIIRRGVRILHTETSTLEEVLAYPNLEELVSKPVDIDHVKLVRLAEHKSIRSIKVCIGYGDTYCNTDTIPSELASIRKFIDRYASQLHDKYYIGIYHVDSAYHLSPSILLTKSHVYISSRFLSYPVQEYVKSFRDMISVSLRGKEIWFQSPNQIYDIGKDRHLHLCFQVDAYSEGKAALIASTIDSIFPETPERISLHFIGQDYENQGRDFLSFLKAFTREAEEQMRRRTSTTGLEYRCRSFSFPLHLGPEANVEELVEFFSPILSEFHFIVESGTPACSHPKEIRDKISFFYRAHEEWMPGLPEYYIYSDVLQLFENFACK